MKLTIHLSKEVADEAEAQILVDLVASRLADKPSVQVFASISESIKVTPG